MNQNMNGSCSEFLLLLDILFRIKADKNRNFDILNCLGQIYLIAIDPHIF